ncbi:hypothetical protein BDR26DRAFT_521898 [Obelidium mucronatum]|nr:hypothetical protein BDR26DRAFT_521898 [Obelidium mucronatum]
MSEFYLSPSVKAQAIPGKGNGFVCCGPEGVREGTLLLRERVFEAWAPGTYAAASIAARLLFRCRQDASNVALLSQLFPATIDMISKARRDQIPAAAVESALRLVAAWEAEADAEAPGTSAERVLPLSRDSLLRFYFVVECNSFPTGLLVTLSFANHSCNPNCAVFEQDPDPCDAEKKPIYTLTAKRDICIGEEITISYIDLVAMVELSEDRQRRLEEHFLFHCSCEWCNSPLDRVGLLKDVPEDSPLLKGPLFEDFSCSAFPQNDKGDCENGMVGRLSGVCSICSRQVTQKMLDKVQEKADRLMVGLRRTLLETNEFLKKMDDAKRERESLVCIFETVNK